MAMFRIDCRSGPARKGIKHEGSKVWVDYFCLRQLRSDFQPEQIEELIRETGAVWVHMDGAVTGSSYPTRSFCVFETAAAIENGATLMIKTPNSGPLQPPTWPCTCCTYSCCTSCVGAGYCHCKPMPDYTIDAANATARRADDKAKVDKYIAEGPGFARVNQMMEREMRRCARQHAWWGPVTLGCWPCAVLGTCFDVCCPRCNPCGWFVA